MKSVSYAGHEFSTADDVADALLRLAAALGQNEKAETVDIPIVEEGGVPNSIQLVVGPASQFVSRHIESPYDDPDGTATVLYLDQRTRAFDVPRAGAVAPGEYDIIDLDGPA